MNLNCAVISILTYQKHLTLSTMYYFCTNEETMVLEKSTPCFFSYLGSRTQKTIFNNIDSTCLPVTHGVAQGSTFGPLLYIMYVNDCFFNVQWLQSRIIMNADDTVLLSSGVSFETMPINYCLISI